MNNVGTVVMVLFGFLIMFTGLVTVVSQSTINTNVFASDNKIDQLIKKICTPHQNFEVEKLNISKIVESCIIDKFNVSSIIGTQIPKTTIFIVADTTQLPPGQKVNFEIVALENQEIVVHQDLESTDRELAFVYSIPVTKYLQQPYLGIRADGSSQVEYKGCDNMVQEFCVLYLDRNSDHTRDVTITYK